MLIGGIVGGILGILCFPFLALIKVLKLNDYYFFPALILNISMYFFMFIYKKIYVNKVINILCKMFFLFAIIMNITVIIFILSFAYSFHI